MAKFLGLLFLALSLTFLHGTLDYFVVLQRNWEVILRHWSRLVTEYKFAEFPIRPNLALSVLFVMFMLIVPIGIVNMALLSTEWQAAGRCSPG